MNDRNRKRLRRGERVRNFASTLTSAFADGSKGAASITNINQIVERINALDASSATNARTIIAVAGAKGDARTQLRDFLRAIARTARAVGTDIPELKDKFRMPSGSLSDQVLLSTARSFVTEATPLKDSFVSYGMAADFLSVLGQKIAAFEEHASRQHTSRNARTSDNAASNSALDQLDEEIGRLNAIMQNTFDADPATLAAWDLARRLERVPQKRKGKDVDNVAQSQPGK
jgi:hypothetical protein